MDMDNQFFENLCEDYYNKILRYIQFAIKNNEAALDIVQEVFLTAYKKGNELEIHPNIGGFMFQTAKNLVKEYKRELYKKIMKEINADYEIEIEDNSSLIETTIDRSINEYDYITDVLSSLSEEKYHLYMLYYINKKPMDIIAKELNIEYATLRMRYVRLRKEIKGLVKTLANEKF